MTRSSGWLRRPDIITLVILLACTAVELVLQLGDRHLIAVPRLRLTAYEYGGFWPGLLRDWVPNYPLQPVSMFLTYGFLHGGLLHLAVNMLTLLSLGRAVNDRLGPVRYTILYSVCILGGAIGYGLLASGLVPMVGASGALFGLAGAIVAWEARDRVRQSLSIQPIVRIVAYLVALNVILWWAMSGHLAWQTHLGGFIAGAIAAVFMDRHGHDDA